MTGAHGGRTTASGTVAEPVRRHGIGAALIKGCQQIYDHCGYQLMYGQTPPTRGLDRFYHRAGFEVGELGAPIDLWVIFGVHSYIQPGTDERIFLRQVRRSRP